MSKICPKCSKELEDDVLVCDSCGEEIAPEEEVKEETAALNDEEAEEAVAAAADEDAEEETDAPADEETEDEADESEDADAANDESAAADQDEASGEADGADAEEATAEESEQTAPEKKKKSFGVGIVVGVCICAIIAGIIALVMLIFASTGSAAALEKYVDSYKKGDYETYFSLDYSVMYKYKDLDDRVAAAAQYGETDTDSLETTVISTTSLSSEAKESMIKQLEANSYEDIDKIQDIQILLMQVSRPSETDPSQNDVWVSTVYALKVDGNWYFASGF